MSNINYSTLLLHFTVVQLRRLYNKQTNGKRSFTPTLDYYIVCLMVFNATFSNISVISWWSVLLVEEIGGPGENNDLSQVNDKLYHPDRDSSSQHQW